MLNVKDVCLQEVFRIYSHGSISYGDFLALLQFCEGKELVVELGTCTGSTTLLLSYMSKKVNTYDIFDSIYLIDNAEQRELYRKNWGQTQHTFTKVQLSLKTRENIFVWKELSYKAACAFENSSVDVLFIDADHSYAGVKRDYTAWFSKVKIGGIFLFHDMVNTETLKGVYKFYTDDLQKDDRVIEETLNTHYLTSIKAFRRIK